MIDFKQKKIAVLGFGIEGQSVTEFLLKQEAEVFVFDEKKEETLPKEKIESFKEKGVQFSFHTIPDLSSYDGIVRSPGISLMQHEIHNAQKKGIPITSATKIFFNLCPCPIIGITGTKGKGTTSTLIFEMLKKQGIDVYLGGNIGVPALTFLDKLTLDSRVVLELSSFQLQDLEKSPHIAVMLMTTSEHLDYHKDVHEYIGAKRNILKFQTMQDYAIVNKDYPASNESDIYTDAKVYKVSREQGIDEGCYIQNDKIILKYQKSNIKTEKNEEIVLDIKEIILPGKHNLENVCAAVMVATLAGVSKENIISVLKTFKGLKHRLELVSTVQGVRYYDDSFSTTPETAMAAIEAFDAPEILILGGSSKKSDFASLGELINSKPNIKAIIGIGKEWEKIKPNIKNQIPKIIEGCKTMQEVVKAAARIATLGDVVLLTPACASFGMFKNYKDRGEQFKKEVMKLKENTFQ